MRQPVGHLTSEGEYFHRLEADLVAKLRTCAELEQQRLRTRQADSSRRTEERLQLAQALNIDDPEVLDLLEKLGYTATTAPVVYLAPVVQVAWADRRVSRAERHCVIAIATARGFDPSTPAYNEVLHWLTHHPGDDFFRGSMRVVHALYTSMPDEQRSTRIDALMHCCAEVASASGGPLHKICASERELLHEISRQLAPKQEHLAATHTGR